MEPEGANAEALRAHVRVDQITQLRSRSDIPRCGWTGAREPVGAVLLRLPPRSPCEPLSTARESAGAPGAVAPGRSAGAGPPPAHVRPRT
ncbi:hypothetical protein WJX79_009946 [Trebouxia sp. C0005]